MASVLVLVVTRDAVVAMATPILVALHVFFVDQVVNGGGDLLVASGDAFLDRVEADARVVFQKRRNVFH
jgi:hypothetical protein